MITTAECLGLTPLTGDMQDRPASGFAWHLLALFSLDDGGEETTPGVFFYADSILRFPPARVSSASLRVSAMLDSTSGSFSGC